MESLEAEAVRPNDESVGELEDLGPMEPGFSRIAFNGSGKTDPGSLEPVDEGAKGQSTGSPFDDTEATAELLAVEEEVATIEEKDGVVYVSETAFKEEPSDSYDPELKNLVESVIHRPS
jgi:hypothetical protein